VDGLVLGHGELTGLQKGGGTRQGGNRGRHFCREEGDDICLFFRTHCSASTTSFSTPCLALST
jgi:hypothetical protein